MYGSLVVTSRTSIMPALRIRIPEVWQLFAPGADGEQILQVSLSPSSPSRGLSESRELSHELLRFSEDNSHRDNWDRIFQTLRCMPAGQMRDSTTARCSLRSRTGRTRGRAGSTTCTAGRGSCTTTAPARAADAAAGAAAPTRPRIRRSRAGRAASSLEGTSPLKPVHPLNY